MLQGRGRTYGCRAFALAPGEVSAAGKTSRMHNHLESRSPHRIRGHASFLLTKQNFSESPLPVRLLNILSRAPSLARNLTTTANNGAATTARCRARGFLAFSMRRGLGAAAQCFQQRFGSGSGQRPAVPTYLWTTSSVLRYCSSRRGVPRIHVGIVRTARSSPVSRPPCGWGRPPVIVTCVAFHAECRSLYEFAYPWIHWRYCRER